MKRIVKGCRTHYKRYQLKAKAVSTHPKGTESDRNCRSVRGLRDYKERCRHAHRHCVLCDNSLILLILHCLLPIKYHRVGNCINKPMLLYRQSYVRINVIVSSSVCLRQPSVVEPERPLDHGREVRLLLLEHRRRRHLVARFLGRQTLPNLGPSNYFLAFMTACGG